MDTDVIIFLIVVSGRFLLPLLILRYPLPGILIALVLDGIDQTIFQLFTDLPLDGYQSYDKALDIYYLTLAYISTFRNWTNKYAFDISRFLFYYRMVGTTLFEFLRVGIILLLFPNTFEYFFIFYEAVRLRWNPDRLAKKRLILVAALIWICIKLPQEYWIHIAKLDTTDVLKEHLFQVPLDAGVGEIVSQNPWVIPAILVLAVVIFAGAKWLLNRLPAADWKIHFDADKQLNTSELQIVDKPAKISWSNPELVEKVVMVSLISIIFTQMMPNVQTTGVEVIIIVCMLILSNTVVSNWLTRGGMKWESVGKEFVVMGLVNYGLLLTYIGVTARVVEVSNIATVLFFTLLITLLVTLYNRYRKIHNARFA